MAERSASPDIRALAYSGAQLVAGFVPLKAHRRRLRPPGASAAIGRAEDPAIASFVHLLQAVHEVGRCALAGGHRALPSGDRARAQHRLRAADRGGPGRAPPPSTWCGARWRRRRRTRAPGWLWPSGAARTRSRRGSSTWPRRACAPGRLDEAAAAAERGNQLLASLELGRAGGHPRAGGDRIIHPAPGRSRRRPPRAPRPAPAAWRRARPWRFFNILSYGWTIEVFLELAASARQRRARDAVCVRPREGLGRLKRCARVFAPAATIYDRNPRPLRATSGAASAPPSAGAPRPGPGPQVRDAPPAGRCSRLAGLSV
jgi:hypothetical protein